MSAKSKSDEISGENRNNWGVTEYVIENDWNWDILVI